MLRVFVYGTLMKGRYNHDWYLKDQKYLGSAVLPGYALYDLGSFPGIIADDKENVRGELYEIDAQTLRHLDILEDNGRLYKRRNAEVWLDDRKMTAYIYIWNDKVHPEDKIDFYFQPWQG